MRSANRKMASETQSRTPRGAPRASPSRWRNTAHRRPARARKAHRAGTNRTPHRPRFVRGIRHVRRASRDGLRHGSTPRAGRRCYHRLRYHQRPRGLRLCQGFYRFWGFAFRGARGKDRQAAGHGSQQSRAAHRAFRFRRGPHPGRGRRARRLRRGFPAQRPGVRGNPPDFPRHGSLRGRRRLFSGAHRFHLHGQGYELYVRDRPRRGEGGDQRDGERRGSRWGVRAYGQKRGGRRRL
jgi:hypothetical protein